MNRPARTYITTAIDYANGAPHMGHAFEKIGADAMARYRRLKGERVHFVMGMDEHGLKVMQSAEAAGITPQAWVDRIAAEFEAMWNALHISNDDFIRTTEDRHIQGAIELIRRVDAAGAFYRGRYEGWYCVGCESFKREDELTLDDAGTRRCTLHPNREVSWSEENNWFFRLSAYSDRLRRLYDERPHFVQPESRYNEIRRLVEAGLEDISVSRSIPWGIPWPDDPSQTVWVWIEALINYVTATGFPKPGWEQYWPAAWHVIGKDITRFHCVIWPAMLMAAGIEPPDAIWAHGFFTFAGRKLSKSEGVRIELADAVARFGPDAFRYYILRDVPWNDDGEFSWERFESRYNADLADNLGNLLNRTASMIERYRGGQIPAGARTWLDDEIAETVQRYTGAMDSNLLHAGADAALDLAGSGNRFIEERAPWSQAKDPAEAAALDATLGSLVRTLVATAVMLEPFIPSKARELVARFGITELPPFDRILSFEAGGQTAPGRVLFPKERPVKPA